MHSPSFHANQEWPYVLRLLVVDPEERANETNALIRCQNVASAHAPTRTAEVCPWAQGRAEQRMATVKRITDKAYKGTNHGYCDKYY